MITLIVFSKDRAAQLDLFLKSLFLNSNNAFVDIKVLYTSSNEEYEKAYDILKKDWQNSVIFIKENDFCINTKHLVSTSHEKICFMTDDDIFYRKADVTANNIDEMFNDMDVGCFSYRLGKNTINQYCNPFPAEIPKFMADFDNKIFLWNKDLLNPHKSINFTYILSVNGHVFRKNIISSLFKSFQYRNPNQLESGLQRFSHYLSPIMGCQAQSSLVNVPVNLVNIDFKNPHGLEYMQDQKTLNDKYLDGYRIVFDKINLSNVNGTHQEFELPMEKNI